MTIYPDEEEGLIVGEFACGPFRKSVIPISFKQTSTGLWLLNNVVYHP